MAVRRGLAAPGIALALLVTAPGPALAQKKPATLTVATTDGDFVDPSISYFTGLKLFNYPDKAGQAGARIQTEAASALKIGDAGRTYTFRIRTGLRSSNGSAVTAATFRAAIDRARDPSAIAGVSSRANTLTIRLTHADGKLLSKLATPAFAVPAGPYYVARRVRNRRLVLRRNRFYRGSRPQRLQQIDYQVMQDPLNAVRQGRADMADVSLAATRRSPGLLELMAKARRRFRVEPQAATDYVALNTSRPTFGSASLRKAANFAIDRPAMLRARGPFAGLPTDQIMPRTMGGFRDASIFPTDGADVEKARALAGGSCGAVNVYSTNGPTGTDWGNRVAQMVRVLGCTPVSLSLFDPGEYAQRLDNPQEPYDMALLRTDPQVSFGDPREFLDGLLGSARRPPNGPNYSHFSSAAFDAFVAGLHRQLLSNFYDEAGAREVQIMRDDAPVIPIDNPTSVFFFSKRVVPKSIVWQPVYGGPALGAARVK
jgi:ABC-type oligopeptide transport system substrate-binding subunit